MTLGPRARGASERTDTGNMKVKLYEGPDGKKYAVLDDKGNPVYVKDDGSEVGIDVPATVGRIGALNKEAQTHRENFEALQGKFKAFEGIEDPEAARTALQTVGNLKQGELKTAAQVEEIRQAALKAAEQQVEQTARQSAQRLKELEAERDQFRDHLYNEKVGGAFARSKFINEKVVTPPDMLQAMFGKNFKVEDGNLVPYGHDGSKLFSQRNPGQLADFDEGIELLINGYAHKNNVLKGTGSSGSGASHGAASPNGGSQGGKPTIARSAWDKLDPAAKGTTARSHNIVDDSAAA